MKIFLIYGHDRNTPVVERIGADLRTAGYTVWIDTSEIKGGDDWRRSIVDGLLDSDWALAFLSKHFTREPGVCLDELAIALHVKGGTIATVLVEDESEVSPPVSVGHIQWLDMHDWEARQRTDPAAFETWYQEKLADILRLLTSPVTAQFAGEIAELDRRLQPIAQEADIGPLVEGFVGRRWLLENLEAWRKGETRSRLFWLTGAPGTGKSAFAAWIAHYSRANVIALNLCRYNSDDRRDPARVLRTLAFQIAVRVADYRQLLLTRLRTHDPDRQETGRRNAADLFDWLLAVPLRLCVDGGRRHDRYVIVIDALDETIRDGRSELAEVLALQAPKLPEWIALVVTSRPEAPIVQVFAGLRPHWIDAESPENVADLRAYAQGWLGADGPIDRVVTAAAGNFQYLRKLREATERGLIRLDTPERLPEGLSGLYLLWFRRQFPDPSHYDREIRPLLNVVVAAGLPVPETLLAEMFGWSAPEKARLLEELGSLFERRSEGVAPYHKSLRDWLADDRAAGAAFVVDVAVGTERLLAALWSRFVDAAGRRDLHGLDEFALAELPRLFFASAKLSRLIATRAMQNLIDVGATVGWEAVINHACALAENQEARYAWAGALAWWDLAARLAAASGQPDGQSSGEAAQYRSAYALSRLGDAYSSIGNTVAAIVAYRSSDTMFQRLADAHPANVDLQHSLSASHDRLGHVLRTQGDLDGALAAFRTAMEIVARLVAADPVKVECQRSLSLSYNNIGDVQQEQGDLDGALAAYRAGIEIRTRLAAADPASTETQDDLAASHDRLGDVLRAKGDLEGALSAYRVGMEIATRLAAADPANAGWQKQLTTSHDRIGSVLLAQGDLPGALASHRTGMEIAVRLAAADPANLLWQHGLLAGHYRIGDVLVAQGDLTGALATYSAALEIAVRLSTADPANAQWLEDLSTTHRAIGDVLRARGDLAGALTAYRAGIEIATRLTAADPTHAARQRAPALDLERIGKVLQDQGDLGGSLDGYRSGFAIRERLVAAEPASAERQEELAGSHAQIGQVLHKQGDIAGALAAYRASTDIRARLAAADPGNARRQRILSAGHTLIGELLRTQGDLAEALTAYRAGIEIRARLAVADPTNTELQADLSLSHEWIGDLLRNQGNLVGALSAYRAEMEIRARLADTDPTNTQRQRALANSHNRVGDLSHAQSDLAGALDAYRAEMEIRTRLVAADPTNAEYQRDLSLSHLRIGDVLSTQGGHAGAAYRSWLEICQRLAGADPTNAKYQRDLSFSYFKVGDLGISRGNFASALAAYRLGMEIATRLAAADPTNVDYQGDLSAGHNRIGIVLRNQGDPEGSLAELSSGLATSERLAALAVDNMTLQRNVAVSHLQISETLLAMNKLGEAREHAHQALTLLRDCATRFPAAPQWATDQQALADLLQRIGERP
jgi:tetratricopeptide (TPR) repeat protein